MGRALYLRFIKNINPIAIGRGKRGFQLAFELYAFVGLAVWIIEMLLYSLHVRFHIFPSPLDMQLIDSTAARVMGVILVTFGFVILVWAFISFGVSWRVGLDVKTPGELVTMGIFAFSRNPIYIFLNCWFVGTFLINGTLIFLIFALLAVAHLHYQILREERFLVRLYGEAYEDYCARTGRYFTL
ncbi:MAG TPA: isoprenylcysteine carboxylmethyltransferase family protein [Pyrinomonadaceae bacterium]